MADKLEIEEEFNNFMVKVSEVERIVKGLSSSDKTTSEGAKALADKLIQGNDVETLPNGRPSSMHCRYNRTVINQKAFDHMGSDGGDPAQMSQETFMAGIERDAAARAKDRKERKERADTLKTRANSAFKKGEYHAALVLYDQAIDLLKDSCVLYENRALTSLNLQLYLRVIDDCNWALKLNENSLKALLYKARAFHGLLDEEGSERCIQEALEKHEKHRDFILQYKESWEVKTSGTSNNTPYS